VGQLDGKVAIITGAASGQGAAEARLFVAQGACVVLGDVSDGPGAALAAELGDRARYVHQDIADEAVWGEVVALAVGEFGGLDVLVNNAGIFDPAPLADTTTASWDRHLAVNQTGAFLGMRAAVGPMIARGGGSIVNTSSITGLKGAPGMYAYTATKWALRGMTKAAAQELGAVGIRVNSLHPGLIETGMIADLPPERREELISTIPLQHAARTRIGQPLDVAGAALWLASDASSFVTGAELSIDGGTAAF
jgi:3alpha(or 20beta)-hydroxysteroid dehydrogenase